MLLYIIIRKYCTCRYRACYAYEIDSGECVIDPASLVVDRLLSFPHQNSTLIMVNTPFTREGVYPPNTICFFVIGNRYIN